MATIWLTYAWVDNKNGDIDFIAQELERTGLAVKLDRWNVSAGKRLWDQIAHFIEQPSESDAWLLVATADSLASEPCKEEFAYALDLRSEKGATHFRLLPSFLVQSTRGLFRHRFELACMSV